MQEEQAREIARDAAEMAVQEVFYRLGLFVDEPDELREYRRDFLFIRSQRRTWRRSGFTSAESRSVSS
jgi:hypothetical protein